MKREKITLVVTGGRDNNDTRAFKFGLKKISKMYKVKLFIHGNASGVDRGCATVAEKLGFRIKSMPADWKNLDVEGAVIKHGQYGSYNAMAGITRNHNMRRLAQKKQQDKKWLPVLLSFAGGTGTANMIRQCKQAQMLVYRVKRERGRYILESLSIKAP